MDKNYLYNLSLNWLENLCLKISDRSVGSGGNREATRFFEAEAKLRGWKTEMPEFDAIDWRDGGASLLCGKREFFVSVSPYSPGFSGEAELVTASTVEELEKADARGKILLVHGDLAREQLMPKNFVFYNPDEHKRIIELLENSGVEAIICATGRNAALAGGVYPFPLIEDGDFNIPSVYMTEEEGSELVGYAGSTVSLISESERIPGKGYNVICRKGPDNSERIVVTAHIDSKKGTPGAIDNATGVVVLLLLAELMRDYAGDKQIELVAFNGEDYYAVPGQMNYIMSNQGSFGNIQLNINIDGAGYLDGLSSFSLFDLPEALSEKTIEIISKYEGITEGIQWPQGDHSIFLQFGVPAIAVSSKWFIDNISTQEITHTPKDNINIVDANKLVEISIAIDHLIRSI